MSGDMLTKTALRERGWSDRLIRELIGAPDQTAANPHYRSGAPVQLYDAERRRGRAAPGIRRLPGAAAETISGLVRRRGPQTAGAAGRD